jgi:hypothetical protein
VRSCCKLPRNKVGHCNNKLYIESCLVCNKVEYGMEVRKLLERDALSGAGRQLKTGAKIEI